MTKVQKKTQENQCCVYDFTCPEESTTIETIKMWCEEHCKKWCFQIEEGESGYIHFQGRISLKRKIRINQVFKLSFCEKTRWSITSNENRDNDFYTCKDDTRIFGPWKDTDVEVYIPRQYKGKLETLRPFQQTIWDSADIFEDRQINCIICKKGNVGKSMIASLCDLYGRGFDIPPINDSEKLIQSVCNMLMGKRCRQPGIIFLDIPRSVKQEKLSGMFVAIEQIKKGKVYDMRYKFRDFWFDSPQIWVFMNIKPKTKYLSRDRWVFWAVNEAFELVKYEPNGKIKKLNFDDEGASNLKSLYESEETSETLDTF